MHTPMGSSEEAEEGMGKSTASCEWNCRSCQMAHRPGAGPEQNAGGKFVFTVVTPSISSSSPFPPPPTPKHTHIPSRHLSRDVSHSPSGSPPACPTGKLWPEPYLAPWPMALHLPPTSLCSTIRLSHTCWSNFILSHINTSLNSTLDYHVLSPDVPPNEKAVSMKLETLSDPLCSSFRALQCWDHTRCFMNIQECAGLFTSSLNLLYGQPRTLSVHESWVGSGGL